VRHVDGELTAYLDGALAPREGERVEAHLQACARCRAERDRLAAAIALLARLPPAPEPSPAFEQRFLARLAGERGARRERRGVLAFLSPRWVAPSLVGAAAAAAMVLYAGRERPADDAFVAAHLDLFESYEAVASVGAVERPEDVQVVAHLDELEKAP
jgi:anti-sigma factor RsiW